MVKARTAWFRIATALIFALWLAVGCTDSNAGEQGVGGAGGDAGAGGTGGNGVEGSSIGPVLGGVNEVTEAVIAENRLLLDALRFAASCVRRTLADAPMTAAATTRQKGGDGPPCILGGIDGMQFIYNEATGAYETSGDGTGPGGTVRFSVYEIVDDAPDAESLIGSLVLSCLGDSAAAHLTANLQVGGVVIVRAEGDARLDPRAGPSVRSTSRGFRRSLRARTALDESILAALGKDFFDFARRRWPHGLYRIRPWVHDERESPRYDEGSGGETHRDSISVSIGTFELQRQFRFEAMLTGTDGSLSGPGILGGRATGSLFRWPLRGHGGEPGRLGLQPGRGLHNHSAAG